MSKKTFIDELRGLREAKSKPAMLKKFAWDKDVVKPEKMQSMDLNKYSEEKVPKKENGKQPVPNVQRMRKEVEDAKEQKRKANGN